MAGSNQYALKWNPRCETADYTSSEIGGRRKSIRTHQNGTGPESHD